MRITPSILGLWVGVWLSTPGCDSGGSSPGAAERQAVAEAEKALAYYLPRLATNPAVASGELIRTPRPTSKDATPLGRERQERDASRMAEFSRQASESLQRLGRLEFRGLTGQGHSGSSGSLSGHYVVMASRWADFSGTNLPVTLTIVNTGVFSLNQDAGLVVENDPRVTGLEGVGSLKFMVTDPSISGLRVLISHSGVRP